MEMRIEPLPKTVDITIDKDEIRGDVNIRIDGILVAYFTRYAGGPSLRICRTSLEKAGFQKYVEV